MTPVASPAPGPYAVASPAPGSGSGGGFKITLGGIKLTSSLGASAGAGAVTNAPPAGNTKSKRVKMEKNYSHMIQDVLGERPRAFRLSPPRSANRKDRRVPGRNSIKKDQYLSHLVMNPDPVPCPPLQVPDPQLLRDALTLKVGGLAGFDMSTWENGPPEGTEKKVSCVSARTALRACGSLGYVATPYPEKEAETATAVPGRDRGGPQEAERTVTRARRVVPSLACGCRLLYSCVVSAQGWQSESSGAVPRRRLCRARFLSLRIVVANHTSFFSRSSVGVPWRLGGPRESPLLREARQFSASAACCLHSRD